MGSHHAFEELRPSHAEGCVVRAGCDTSRPRRGKVTARITEIAVSRLQVAGEVSVAGKVRLGHGHSITFVRNHEDAAIWAILGAQPTSDAVVLNDNLEVLAPMNGVNRTAHHAMWIGARPAGGGDEEIIQALSGTQ